MNHNQPTPNKHAQAHNKPVLFEVNSARAVTRYLSQDLVDKVASELLGLSLFEFRAKYINEAPAIQQEATHDPSMGSIDLYSEEKSRPDYIGAIATQTESGNFAVTTPAEPAAPAGNVYDLDTARQNVHAAYPQLPAEENGDSRVKAA